MTKKNIYLVILKLLREKGLTQTEFAKKAGISQPALSAIMSGKYEPKISTIEKIAKGFDISFEELAATITGKETNIKKSKNTEDKKNATELRLDFLEEKMKRLETEIAMLKKER